MKTKYPTIDALSILVALLSKSELFKMKLVRSYNDTQFVAVALFVVTIISP